MFWLIHETSAIPYPRSTWVHVQHDQRLKGGGLGFYGLLQNHQADSTQGLSALTCFTGPCGRVRPTASCEQAAYYVDHVFNGMNADCRQTCPAAMHVFSYMPTGRAVIQDFLMSWHGQLNKITK